MRIMAWAVLLSAFLVLDGSFVSATGSVSPKRSKPSYLAEITVTPEEQHIAGTVTIRLPVIGEKSAFFHLYPAAFNQGAKHIGPERAWTETIGKQTKPGAYDVQEVCVQGKKVPFSINGTILQVPLVTQKEETTEVQIRFDCKLPLNEGRFSYDEHSLWLGNWLPVLAVKQGERWRLDPYYPIGDPFFSETADYELKITLPVQYQIASTGVEQLDEISFLPTNRQKQHIIKATNVRDFALVVMDHTYQKRSSKVGNTVVQTWWRTDDNLQQVNQLHNTAVQALAYYNQQFGTYPYQEYDLVRTGGTFGGMEYPGLVFIQGEYFQKLNDLSMAIVAHETAHQWFYGLVGSDEVNEAWLDEGVTEYAALSFLQQRNPDLANRRLTLLNINGNMISSSLKSPAFSARQSLERYPDWQTYSQLVYARPAMMLWEIRKTWGEEKLHKVLRKYVQEYQFANASEKELTHVFSEAAGSDATSFFDYWIGLDETKADEARSWLERGRKMP